MSRAVSSGVSSSGFRVVLFILLFELQHLFSLLHVSMQKEEALLHFSFMLFHLIIFCFLKSRVVFSDRCCKFGLQFGKETEHSKFKKLAPKSFSLLSLFCGFYFNESLHHYITSTLSDDQFNQIGTFEANIKSFAIEKSNQKEKRIVNYKMREENIHGITIRDKE